MSSISFYYYFETGSLPELLRETRDQQAPAPPVSVSREAGGYEYT